MKTILPSLITILILMGFVSTSHAQGVPFTANDLALESAINSQQITLDVLSNDDSGIAGDNYKEVIGVCATATSDADCTTTNFTDGVATVTIAATGDANNVGLTSNHDSTYSFDFKYIMQNSNNATGVGLAVVALTHFEVNSLTDANDGNCNATNCTLREAMTFALNDNEPSAINFKRDLQGTINLNSQLTIDSNDLSIIGPGAAKIILSGNGSNRVLEVPTGTERFTLTGLTLADGVTGGSNNGAGLLIENSFEISISGVKVSNNSSGGDGGGVYISGASVTFQNSEISYNFASGNGGGISISGGFGNEVTLENSTLSNNESLDFGSGLFTNTNSGHNLNLKFITAAYNPATVADNRIEGTGNVFIESSVFEPSLSITNANNISNNSIFSNLGDGSIFGDNNRTEVGPVLNSTMSELNNSGLSGHTFDTDSLAYNHVDTQFGNSGCGTQITTDQFGNNRPNEGACDAGAYEYIFIDLIFAAGFE